ncbi:glycosyltransferase [Hymenobacter sp. BT188]|uniref:glycosyltransferase n=1 Tax=Hymenobacter sp. BT188 TaxID=2763504 RepID=UPI0016516189|nr:glycosyltransferase [Hymenobacter sp. BT188]MBC6606729.1 glycosyltransferase [Hymenobacter sp. BT188]
MENPNLKVLLLGWDETTQVTDSDQPESLPLLQALASRTTLTAILPHLPTGQLSNARITSLDTLTLADLDELQPVRDISSWQSPAAPYIGAAQDQTEEAGLGEAASEETDYLIQNSPPDLLLADEQAVEASEPGADEAHDLDQPGDNLTLDKPAVTVQPEYLPPIEFSADRATLRNLLNALPEAPGDLNFQVIQYTRFATRLALREQFGVIYAPEWHVWLAGLEIRQLTGRPLVLHVHSLALDRDSPNDRGWILELERLALRRATLVLAATETLAERLQSAYSVAADRIKVVAAHDEEALTVALQSINRN